MKKIKWAYKALCVQDAADAALDHFPCMIIMYGVAGVAAGGGAFLRGGIEDMASLVPVVAGGLVATAIVAALLVAVRFSCSAIIRILGWTEEGLEQLCQQ